MSEAANEKASRSSDAGSNQLVFERPTGIRGLYLHPKFQIALLGFICFMGPGLFNALSGLGGAGQVDATTSANANAALYATFAFAAFFAGSINNILGPRLTLQMGSCGYSLYIGSLLASNLHTNVSGFVIAAGAILGVCAGLLWTAQGSIMLSYPTEATKGQSIYVFWCIFNLGGVVGAAVAFGNNFHSTSNSVSNSTYIAFLVLTLIGVTIPMFMADPKRMIRVDGTRVVTPRHPSWRTEIYGLFVAMRTDPLIFLLFPMFFASNWFYTWQFNDYNGALFNIRTRSLNSMLYWSSQVVGSIIIGVLLDYQKLTRRVRAFSAWLVLLLMVFAIHIWAYEYQKDYTRQSIPPDSQKMDLKDSRYPGRVILYIGFGILDAMWQSTIYWLMGAMSNDPAKLAYFTGFYKSIQSAGAAGIWRADAVGLPYLNLFISEWVLLAAGLIFCLPMIHLRVKEHTVLEDETVARMDDVGHIRPVDEVAKDVGAPVDTKEEEA